MRQTRDDHGCYRRAFKSDTWNYDWRLVGWQPHRQEGPRLRQSEHQGLTSRDTTGGPGTSKDSTSGTGLTSEDLSGESAFTLHRGTCMAFMLGTVQQRKPTVACIRCSGTSRAKQAGQQAVPRHLWQHLNHVYFIPGYMYLRLRNGHICIQYSKLWFFLFNLYLPYYCTPICVCSCCNWRASCVYPKPKK